MNKGQQYFVGIGAAKAGSTWLARYLESHPQVCMSPYKELHYFDSIFVPELVTDAISRRFAEQLSQTASKIDTGKEVNLIYRVRDLAKRLEMNVNPRAYVEYFDNLLKPHHRAFGEITPSYSMIGEGGFKAILGLYPMAKFILILRNPVDRFWSQIRFSQKIVPGFSASAEARRRLSDPQYTERGNYRLTLDSLECAVPSRQVYVAFYEDLFGPKGRGEMKRLTGFLGIDHREADHSMVVNRGVEESMDPSVRSAALQRFETAYSAVAERYRACLPESWKRDIEELRGASKH